MSFRKRKLNYKIGDLVKHRFINYGYGIVIAKRFSKTFGEILDSYIVHFPKEDLKRLIQILLGMSYPN